MKRIVLVIAMLALVGVVSATTYGLIVSKSHAVVDPHNILAPNTTYAIGQYTDDARCPPGDFNSAPGFCTEDDSGKNVTGWELVLVNGTTSNGTLTLGLTHANFNDGCSGAGCNKSTKSLIFVTSDYTGNSTDWEFVGAYTPLINIVDTQFIPVDGPVDAVLVARGPSSDHRPDPRWYELRVFD